MIKAVADKIIVKYMRAMRTKGGLVLPDTAADPQGYGEVLTVGELVAEGTDIKPGDILVFHPRAGMDMMMNNQILKTLKYEEIYGILEDEEIKSSLEAMLFAKKDESRIIKSASTLIS